MSETLFKYVDDLGKSHLVHITKSHFNEVPRLGAGHPVADVEDVKTGETIRSVAIIRLRPVSPAPSASTAEVQAV